MKTGTVQTLSLPGAVLQVPKPEVSFPMRVSDWKRMRAKVESLRTKRRDWAALAWAAIGLAAGAGLGLIAWLPASATLTDAQRAGFAWITPTLIVVGLACIVIAILAFLSASDFAKAERATALELAEEMDAIFHTVS